ncbi:murein L,D-transpeptidase catalytic domain-containing protein [Sphingobacterium sp. Ag1]|uniref:murein L,D-transpeptidase catalytic domain-containing protein n=1 Tax=Sphingobacterium sp. Ag1 TaxID=1643451 RepID=UPI00069A4F48|nr:murein L,D-transpeptidase catalytic domain family protein [Sphingobacterium sp. Ag1]
MKKLSITPSFGDKGLHVESVQIRLTELGFSLGNIDGSFGNQTRDAIISFQASHGIKDDGKLNENTLRLLDLEVDKDALSDNSFIAIPYIVDRLGISRIRWENGNRGQAPYGYYYGMGLVYAALYERLKKGERIAKEMCKPLSASEDVDALRRFQATIIDETGNKLNDESNILRGLFLLMLGLGVMESNGKFCCGWDRGKEYGWGNPAKKIQPTAENSEAGLFQTSFDVISAGSIPTAVKNMLMEIFQKYKSSRDGYLEFFSKGAKCNERDAENYGTGVGLEFQVLAKQCPAFTVEFSALALRSAALHWNPVIHVNNSEKGLQIKKESNEMLMQIEEYIDKQLDEASKETLQRFELKSTQLDALKVVALELADAIGQRERLQELFEYAPGSKANYWAIVDYNKPSTEKRLFIFDLKNKDVKSYMVSHGRKSGDLYATEFSNTPESNKSCLGIFKTKSTYMGKNGRSLKIEGLQTTNNNASARYIVIHEGKYVSDENAGRSLGCFVVAPNYAKEVIDHLMDGSYLLAWHS